jgi:hypothetical protein
LRFAELLSRRVARAAFVTAATGLALVGAAACSPPGSAGGIVVTASGEALGQQGFPFPPATSRDTYFVDGWTVTFDELLVTFDDIVVNEGPDTSPTDQSQVGKRVASLHGPFAVDLHKPGPLAGKEDGTTAFTLGRIPDQNENGGDSFHADTKYALGFAFVPASPGATRLNFDATNEADYADMVKSGYSVLYVGTARFTGTTCTPASGADKTLDALPTTVHFRFGFRAHPRFVNCQNPDLGDDATGGNPRGIAMKANTDAIAQLTVHADHPFWDARQEDSALRFDAVALIAKEKGLSVVTLDDLAGVPYLPITVSGVTLPSRTCAPAAAPTSKSELYDPKGATFPDLQSYVIDRQSSQGHLNADGLCYVTTQ